MHRAHSCHDLHSQLAPPNRTGLGRRDFLRTAALGVAAAAGVAAFSGPVWGSGGTDALLLSCMDYRLMDDIMRYMARRELTNKYDHVILAGASLGAQTEKYPDWGKTFWDHLDVSLQLHHIHTVVVIDHRDCGAYKTFLGKDFAKDPEAELAIHARYLRSFEAAIRAKYPKLSIDLLLMNLSGKVEMIT